MSVAGGNLGVAGGSLVCGGVINAEKQRERRERRGGEKEED